MIWEAMSSLPIDAHPKCLSSDTELSSMAVGLAMFLKARERPVCLAPCEYIYICMGGGMEVECKGKN